MKKLIILIVILGSMNVSGKSRWITYRIAEEHSPKNDICSVCFDRDGCLWAGTDYGVYQNKDGKWIARGTENVYVQTLFIDAENRKWAGLWGGGIFLCGSDDDWKHAPDASPTGSVNVITADHDGNIWIGDWGGGAVMLGDTAGGYAGKKRIVYKAGEAQVNLGDNTVTSAVCDARGRMWLGTYHGISVFHDGLWTLYNSENSNLPDNDVYALAAGKDGCVWIGTCDGLVKVFGQEWTVYHTENSGLSCDLVLALATGEDGTIWVGTNKGLFSFDGKKWTNFTVENSGLADNRIQTVTLYHEKIYVGTSQGISVCDQ